MIYCISDIHGEYDRYKKMLGLIGLTEKDTLYVLGDVVDRHPNGIDVLLDIMQRDNVHMCLGNHEDLLYATLGPVQVFGARQLWQQNGGSSTRRELLYMRTKEERLAILRFIESLPDHFNIVVNGEPFHLVHGWPGHTKDVRIWGRPEPIPTEPPIYGVTTIIGHTPTVYLHGDDGNPFRIWHGPGVIDIDCGCGNETEKRRLACLRLDDMKEFYA